MTGLVIASLEGKYEDSQLTSIVRIEELRALFDGQRVDASSVMSTHFDLNLRNTWHTGSCVHQRQTDCGKDETRNHLEREFGSHLVLIGSKKADTKNPAR